MLAGVASLSIDEFVDLQSGEEPNKQLTKYTIRRDNADEFGHLHPGPDM